MRTTSDQTPESGNITKPSIEVRVTHDAALELTRGAEEAGLAGDPEAAIRLAQRATRL